MVNQRRRIHSVVFGVVSNLILLAAIQVGAELGDQSTRNDPETESDSKGQVPSMELPKQGEIEKRGIQGAPLQGLQPNAAAPFLRYHAPTENLTAVANTLRLKHKGLTTVITTMPGLSLTQPVEISIAYISSAGTNRITQSYFKKFGNRIVYDDPEGEGQPRRLRMDIWLNEPKPGGGLYTYSISWQADLDPIYDITINPLVFTLLSNCDYIGNSEIRFKWRSPDGEQHHFNFTTTKGRRISIEPFAWARMEVSDSANLHLPAILWKEHDSSLLPPHTEYDPVPSFSTVKLLPGKTMNFQFALFPGQPYPGPPEIHGNTCIAQIQYTITYTLHRYPTL